ncbi:hypothetical protein AB0Q95_06145 [Streptomyces sp. NPDC059900]|uniref:hypothetical protein n=1 Tax=Streptomyces sp. NPDC059900 TaxID=3155816 RepID=UPI00343D2A9C
MSGEPQHNEQRRQREDLLQFPGDTHEPGVAYNITQMIVQTGAVIAATTFLQTLVQHFGSRLAGTLDDGTRTAVRRFLRRQQRDSGGLEAGIQLRTEQGWRVSLTPDVPAEALLQLSDICDADPPHPDIAPFLISYGRGSWEGWGGIDGEFAFYRWDPAEKRWASRRQSR